MLFNPLLLKAGAGAAIVLAVVGYGKWQHYQGTLTERLACQAKLDAATIEGNAKDATTRRKQNEVLNRDITDNALDSILRSGTF